ncbi:hypothetical protein GIB67_039881, partial [Kingdonia uniflora]
LALFSLSLSLSQRFQVQRSSLFSLLLVALKFIFDFPLAANRGLCILFGIQGFPFKVTWSSFSKYVQISGCIAQKMNCWRRM